MDREKLLQINWAVETTAVICIAANLAVVLEPRNYAVPGSCLG